MATISAANNPAQLTGQGSIPVSGVPWWGNQNLSLVGGRTGFQTPPSEWDVLRYGPNNVPLPGLLKVRRCERRMKLHRKEHPSSDFETQTFQGWSVVEFDFSLKLWTPQHLADLQGALAYLFPGAGDPPDPTSSVSVVTVASNMNLVNPTNSASGTAALQQIQVQPNSPKRPPIPIKVYHPALLMHAVDTVVFQSMDGPYQASDGVPDIFVCHFKTVQFRPSKQVQHKTLDRPNTNQGGDNGFGGFFLHGSYSGAQSGQLPYQGPSVSGGADPTGVAQYTNFLESPVGS
jgi:hypothetical protein